MVLSSFRDFFSSLWSYEPFPWQRMLAERLVAGEWPKALDLPTAAGKTVCIDVAVYALAAQADRLVWERTAPRRIWFVVDRRIVVDEAFERAREIARRLAEAEDGPLKMIADRLREISGTERPLAAARLRGGVLRDDGWARLPSQPAIITSTVDQLGSRLLFRGYGRSALAAPIFAGLAAHDSLILLDEAHLSVPFMQTLRAVERYRGEKWAEQPIRTPFTFSILSATPPADVPDTAVFPGSDRDTALDHPALSKRINASKPAELVSVTSAKSSAKDMFVEEAVKHSISFVKDGKQRVAVIVNRVSTAGCITKNLQERLGVESDIVLLTGRLRPYERDQLVSRWKPFLKAGQPKQSERPVTLVTTQCIEVGADFSFDALVTEAASLDALRQRFGRLNRLGELNKAPAVILIRDEDTRDGTEDFIYGNALSKCWNLLLELSETQEEGGQTRTIIDFGIAALDTKLQAIDNLSPFIAPAQNAPLLLPSHLDLLCQTAPRPCVEPDISFYLHGAGRGMPDVRVCWRADLRADDPEKNTRWPETVSLCPPNSAETMTVPLYQLQKWLAESSGTEGDADVEGASGSIQQAHISIRPVLLWRGRERSRVCTRSEDLKPNDVIVLPAIYGITGLGQAAPENALGENQLDIWEPSHAQSGKPIALRLQRDVLKPWLNCSPLRLLLEQAENPEWNHDDVQNAIDAVLAYKQQDADEPSCPPGWLLTLLEKTRKNGRWEQHPAGGLVLFEHEKESLHSGEQDLFADDDDLLSATGQEVSLAIHSTSVERAVSKFATHCLPQAFQETLETAAYWHDVGKLDERFQILLRQGNELAALAEPLAKSATIPDSPARRRAIRMASSLPREFRHEMLSLRLAECCLPNNGEGESGDLLLHMISSHHGYGRPFAPLCLDSEPPPVRYTHGSTAIEISAAERVTWPAPHALSSGVSERFWRLTRRYGWWGLAYLEAILRLSDWYGSRWMVKEASPRSGPTLDPISPAVRQKKDKSLVLKGMDGANPLGFMAAIGALLVLHQSGYRNSHLAWQRQGLAWQPVLCGLTTDDPAVFSEMLAENLQGVVISDESEEKRKAAEKRFSQKKKSIKDKRDEIKKRGLRGKERNQAIEAEVVPLECELEELRKIWLEALHQSVSRPELALGKNIDCTDLEYRTIAEPLLESASIDSREPLDMLAAFCSVGCLHESLSKRKEGKLAATPFSFISGSGHQDFLDTAGALLKNVSAARLQAALFEPWNYEDDGLSMRWDPVEDRRYALMDRDPTAADNKPRTVWMANLLAYRALALFPSVPTRRGLATVGWAQQEEPCFTWPLWSYPLGPDSIRSLLVSPELSLAILHTEVRTALHARGVESIYRARRIKVGEGANFKINFSPARQI